MQLSKRARNLKPSATLAITAKAKQMKADGIDVIGFGAGEPDFATPKHIIDAAVAALESGDTHYTPVGGGPALKGAISTYMKREYGLDYAAAEVTASCGAKHTLFNLFMTIIDDGDEVIIPAPYWVSYPEQVQLAGGVPVIVTPDEDEGFLLSAQKLAAAITDRTKAVIINSPSNPSGAMYNSQQMEALADVLKDREIIVVSDDIYHKLIYGDVKFTSILDVAPAMRDRVVVVNGVSKTYAMTGWRLGFAAGPKEIISAMEKLQGQSTSNPTSFAQAGGVVAMAGEQSCVDDMKVIFDRRRNLLVDGLNTIDGVECPTPVGAFYAFPSLASFVGTSDGTRTINDSMDIAAYLLEEAEVAVVPGTPFGSPHNVRMSYATSEALIEEGLKRMAAALAKLKR